MQTAKKKYPTPKQKEVLDVITESIIKNGYPPTLREMAEKIGISSVSVFGRIEGLKNKGLLRNHPKHARSWVIVRQ